LAFSKWQLLANISLSPTAALARRQTIRQTHTDPLVQATLAHGTLSRVKRRNSDLPRHRSRDGATAQQCHRQIGVIRADREIS
jgi:hypothetical protein